MSFRLDVKVIDVGFYTILYIHAHIWSWQMTNTRKIPYHVLGSTYRIGDGSGTSSIPIRMIYYHCTDSSGNIFACTRLHSGLRWCLLCHRHLRVDICWMPPHSSSIWPWSGVPKVRLYGTLLSSLCPSPHKWRFSMGSIREEPLKEKILSHLSACDMTPVVSLDTNNQA
jgi:hypothetical protein